MILLETPFMSENYSDCSNFISLFQNSLTVLFTGTEKRDTNFQSYELRLHEVRQIDGTNFTIDKTKMMF